MPMIYSPGEAETRPLNPDAIVYTTAQKVAELLGIGPGEAVAVSANTIANAVFVTEFMLQVRIIVTLDIV